METVSEITVSRTERHKCTNICPWFRARRGTKPRENNLTLISTPGVHVDLRYTFCEILYDVFVIFLPNFMYPSPIHTSLWRQNITYLGLAQKPAHTILHWGPRGPQTHQFWKTMQAWVWLLTYWSLLLGNCSHVTRERSSDQFFSRSSWPRPFSP